MRQGRRGRERRVNAGLDLVEFVQAGWEILTGTLWSGTAFPGADQTTRWIR